MNRLAKIAGCSTTAASLLVSLPEGQWVPTGERLRVSGEPQQEQSGWLLQVEDISQVSV